MKQGVKKDMTDGWGLLVHQADRESRDSLSRREEA